MKSAESLNGVYAEAQDGDAGYITSAYRLAFGFSDEWVDGYISHVGLEKFRIFSVDDRRAAVMALLPAGHWLGGRVVGAVNICHVAVAPEFRGLGLASSFLERACYEAKQRGFPLATLFASTRPVYRRAGFALAGVEMIYEAETRELGRTRGAQFIRLDLANAIEHLTPLRRESDRRDAGPLNRHTAHWSAILQGASGIYVNADGDAPGYVVLDTSDASCLQVRDWVALNGLAARHILSLLGTFASVFSTVRWHGSPHDPLVYALPDKGWRLLHQEDWLARVLDPVLAFEQRGYPPINVDLTFNLATPDGDRKLRLEVRGSSARCQERQGSAPELSLSLNELGTLLTGHRSASFLRRAGALSGDDDTVAIAERLFSGPLPWVAEHF